MSAPTPCKRAFERGEEGEKANRGGAYVRSEIASRSFVSVFCVAGKNKTRK
jgi:hypothetical protein